MDKSMKSVFVVYSVADWSNEAAFSLESDALAWIDRQNSPDDYDVEELPIDTCIDGHDVYAITHDVDDNTWTAHKSNTSFEHPPLYYEGEDWWSVCVQAKSKDDALEKSKRLISKAIEENQSC